MKLHAATLPGIRLFTAYGVDYVAVDHESHQENLILAPDRLTLAWSASRGEAKADDLARLLDWCREHRVDIVLLGTGSRLRFPPGPLLQNFLLAGVGIEVMDLQAACRTYNILAAEGRQVAAALLFDAPAGAA